MYRRIHHSSRHDYRASERARGDLISDFSGRDEPGFERSRRDRLRL
jgi:hypothetical protein